MKFLAIFAILSVLTATVVAEEPKKLADMKTLAEDMKELQKGLQDEELQFFIFGTPKPTGQASQTKPAQQPVFPLPKPVERPTSQPTQPTATTIISIGSGYPTFQYPEVHYPGVELIDESEVEDLKVNDIPKKVAPKSEVDELLAFLEVY